MKEKPAHLDMRLFKALQPTLGWNPIMRVSNRVANIRCMNCGTLMAVAPADMAGEWEHRCPICGHLHVFNRQPRKLDTRQREANQKMMLNAIEASLLEDHWKPR